MATAAAVQGSRTVWHVRGSWSARDDRIASAVWLAIFWVGIIAGFSVDFPRYFRENPPPPTVVHVHAVIFTIWLFIATAQVLFVLRDRLAWHRKFGWFAAAWACLLVVMGPWAAMASQAVNLHTPAMSDPPFISVNIVDIGGFIVLLAYGVAVRTNPALHKRMMILSLVAIADPGFARFSGWLLPSPTSILPWFFYLFYGNVLMVVLMVAWDWWKGRLMRPFVIAAAAVVASELVASVLYFWPPWKTMTLSWIQAWARL